MEDGFDVTIPAGSLTRSLPGPDESAEPFETSEPLEARARWNALPLRMSRPQVLFLPRKASTETAFAYLAGTDTGVEAGQRVLVSTSRKVDAYDLLSVEPDEEAGLTRIALADKQAVSVPLAEQTAQTQVFSPLEQLGEVVKGQTLLPYIADALESVSVGLRRLEDSCKSGALTVSTTPSFGTSWLAPRLSRFQARHPEIELQLSATSRVTDLEREGIDCGIRYGMGDWPNLITERLFHTPLIPVCSPSFLEENVTLRQPSDLAHHTLLHVLGDLDDWRLWLQAVGAEGVDPIPGPKFDSGPLALQAAINGSGIAIARAPLVRGDLAKGRLVTPFDLEVPETCAYYFVVADANTEQIKIKAFRDWLMEEVAAIKN